MNSLKGKPRILISHDESTFKSGETRGKRWLFPKSAPFHNKGRGRSMMLSYFTVCAEDSIFELDEQEWNSAINEHPELDESQNQMSFFNRTASAWIEPGKDCYFNNEDILYQFERLFKLLKFKKAYGNFEVEILVDNARTHTSKLYDLNNLNKHSSIKSSFYSHKMLFKAFFTNFHPSFIFSINFGNIS